MRNERGAGMALAIIVGAMLLAGAALMLRLGWETSALGHEGILRVQASAAAASIANAQMAVVQDILTNRLVTNIMEQGCRAQSTGATKTCTTAGRDTAKTSGIRRDLIATAASQSAASWSNLQSYFWSTFSQVSPVGSEVDPYRTPAATGITPGVMDGTMTIATPGVPVTLRAYATIAPVPGKPITYDSTQKIARVPFEVRIYGWAQATARSGLVTSAQATLWSTNGLVELTYPNCPAYWAPDEICMYPATVNITLPAYSILYNDPTVVRWPW